MAELKVGDCVLIEVRVDGHATVEYAKILRLNERWAILRLDKRSVTAYLSQIRPVRNLDALPATLAQALRDKLV